MRAVQDNVGTLLCSMATAPTGTVMPAPTWISHRGYCQNATENTAEAFRAALDLGFYHLETDLRMSADGHIVLSHDRDLGRLSGRAAKVEQCPREVLEKLRLNGGERLLFFDQLVSEFADQHWIFDIKPETALRTLDALKPWWQQAKLANFFRQRVRFLFWNKEHQNYLLEHDPDAVCMAQISECRRAGLACVGGLPTLSGIKPGLTYALPPRFTGLNTMRHRIVERYKSCGAKVLAYLPETDKDAARAVDAGVDEILTNGKPLRHD